MIATKCSFAIDWFRFSDRILIVMIYAGVYMHVAYMYNVHVSTSLSATVGLNKR